MHWTQRSVSDFVYNISATFVSQLESKMEKDRISQSQLAERLNKTDGRVSQVFNNPGNLGLRVIVEFARALDMKVCIVAYDDGDHNNISGPINPNVFVESWEKLDCPTDLFEVREASICKPQTICGTTFAFNNGMNDQPFYGDITNTKPCLYGNVLGTPVDTTKTMYFESKLQSFPVLEERPETQRPEREEKLAS